MALFTKLFERNHNPYDIPGARWYKFHLTSDGTTPTLVSSDIPTATLSISKRLRIPSGYKFVDYIAIFKSIAGNGSGYTKSVYFINADETLEIVLPPVDRYTEADVYIYLDKI